ncbi:MAG: NnrS family protein [Hyphomicrobiaceae bacterium]
MSTMQKSRDWQGPPVFSFGFRPFFLGAAVYAGLVVALWVPWYLDAIEMPTAFGPLTWHAHELLFGSTFAIIAGFLLTAVPNWTGRLPVVGYSLMMLFGLWVMGRLTVAVSAALDPISLALLSLVFPIALVFVMGREILVGGNTKNLIIIAAVSVLTLSQALTQYEHWSEASNPVGTRLGLAAIVALIMLIGGRVTPSFTRNWLRKSNPGREPSPIGRFDLLTLLVGASSLLLWAVSPLLPDWTPVPVGWILLGAGLMHLARQLRWVPHRVIREPIVLILHIGYLFVPVGLLLTGLALSDLLHTPEIAGIHAWSAGAIGVMTLAVMTRATLGHTGREITASRTTVVIYLAAIGAAFTRLAAALIPEVSRTLLEASAVLWCVAFLGFAVVYGRMLIAPRV